MFDYIVIALVAVVLLVCLIKLRLPGQVRKPAVKSTSASNMPMFVVSWESRYGEYPGNTTRIFRAFLSKEEANEFARQLREAQKLLSNTKDISIKVEKGS